MPAMSDPLRCGHTFFMKIAASIAGGRELRAFT